jgi:hypothetical protein
MVQFQKTSGTTWQGSGGLGGLAREMTLAGKQNISQFVALAAGIKADTFILNHLAHPRIEDLTEICTIV